MLLKLSVFLPPLFFFFFSFVCSNHDIANSNDVSLDTGHAVPEESSIVLPPPVEKAAAPVAVIGAEHSPVIEDEV